MVKVRIQLKSEARGANLNPFNIANEIYKEGGMRRFYKGYIINLKYFNIDWIQR